MLVLKRREGQWVELTHKSGDTIRVRVCKIEGGTAGQAGHLNLAFDDEARHFEIERPERSRGADSVRSEPVPVIPIDPQYYRGTLVEPGFDEFRKR